MGDTSKASQRSTAGDEALGNGVGARFTVCAPLANKVSNGLLQKYLVAALLLPSKDPVDDIIDRHIHTRVRE